MKNQYIFPGYPYYLLDIFPAKLGVGIFNRNSSYTGAWGRVRRDSDFTEQDIGFTSFLNPLFDVDQLETFCSGANCYIAQLKDYSGNSYDLSQSTAAKQPKIYDSATGVVMLGGLPAIDLSTGSLFNHSINIVQPFSLFLSLSLQPSDEINYLFAGTNPLNQIYLRILGQNPDDPRIQLGGVLSGSSSGLALNVADFPDNALFSVFAEFANSLLFINSGSLGSSVNLLSASLPGFSVGQEADGNPYIKDPTKFSELIIYESDQRINRTVIEKNINGLYRIY
jgi:Alpha-L-arabinofuranosidase B, catalytic